MAAMTENKHDTPLGEGDVIQITKADHPWRGCFLTVDEVRPWGVKAYLAMPQSNAENDVALAYNRAITGDFERIGKAALTFG